MQERELLRRIEQRDEAALRELYLCYQPKLARFLGRFTHHRQIIEEVINDTLLVVWQNCSQFRGDSSPTTWIMGISYKKMLKALKRNQPFRTLVTDMVEATYLKAEDNKATDITEAVRQLPEVQAAVVVLTYDFGYSYREISEILDCPENTVKTRMFHARKALKVMLEAS